VERRAAQLVAYQGRRLARRYRERIAAAEKVDPELAAVMAKSYHRLLAYKDEYEVARLHSETLQAAVDAQFTDVRAMRFHLAPPILGGADARGRPKKRSFGPWMLKVFDGLRRLKVLRGTPLDPFGYSAERRMERALIREYEADMDAVLAVLTPANRDVALELAALPLEIRGFGPVKMAAAEAAAARRAELKAAFAAGGRAAKLHAAE
jgi:indolepyruvate ferredoxin oxidoreductase